MRSSSSSCSGSWRLVHQLLALEATARAQLGPRATARLVHSRPQLALEATARQVMRAGVLVIIMVAVVLVVRLVVVRATLREEGVVRRQRRRARDRQELSAPARDLRAVCGTLS